MILYHGTYTDFQEIRLDKCLPYKDFGQGFYLTDIFEQALNRVYTSRTFALLNDPEADLTSESPAYIYELLKREIAQPDLWRVACTNYE